MKSVLALLGASLLAGSSVPLIRPDADEAISAHYQADVPSRGASLDMDWWARIGDPTLTQLLSLAQSNSPDLRTAAANVVSARALAGQGSVALSPSVTGTSAASISKTNALPRSYSDTALIDARWEVDLFGSARNGARVALTRAQAEEVSYAGSYVSLAAEVADGYMNYRACKLTEAEYRSALASQRQTVEATNSLVRAGMSASADLSLARANVANAEISLTNQSADCRVNAQQLTRVVGVSQAQIDTLLAKGADLPSSQPFRVASVPADMLRQRPDVIGAEKRFAARLLDMKVAEANLYPSLVMSGTVGLASPSSWSFGPVLSLPFLDGGASKASLRAANADALSAAETYRSTVLAAVAEVEGALTRLGAARSNLASAENLVQQYQSHFNAVDEEWQAGSASLLDREDARRRVQSARIMRISQREALMVQWIALYKAVGGGWTPQTALNQTGPALATKAQSSAPMSPLKQPAVVARTES